MRWTAGAAAAALFLLALCWRTGTAQQAPGTMASADDMDSFVAISDGQFVVNCKTFYVSGWNQWETVEAAAGALELYGASLPPDTTGPALVRRLLDRAVANGFSVVRAWATAVSPQYALETSPGQFNEAVFRGLDYLLDEARKRGIRVLLSLTDNWQQTGGADQMVRWVGGGLTHEDFFTDTRVKALYKGHVQAVLTRTNSINGRVYSQDPTIFALDLINEPRCYQCGTAMQLWVQEMAAYVKSLDANHLLTVGEEGFYPVGVPQAAANPGGADSWATLEGQNFVADHASPDIDFMAIHLWVNNWNDKSPEFVQRWMSQHIADAQASGKPLLLEEFGVWSGDGQGRTQYYRQILDLVQQNAQAGGPLKGALFWTWYAEGQRAPAEEQGGASGLFGVFESNKQNWPVIQGFAQALGQLDGALLAQCASHRSADGLPPVPACPAGYEGPSCSTDVNECVRGLAACAPNATCTNTPGGYICACYPGYSGDAKASCQADPGALAATTARYATNGTGKLACSEGQDVAYPEGAPGFAYDPTGGLSRPGVGGQPAQGQFGSRLPVDPLACMQACDEVPACTSFSYNPTQKKCFLKAGGTRQTCQAAPTTCVSARGQPYSCGIWQTYFKTAAAPGAGVAPSSSGGSVSPRASVQLLPPATKGTTVQLLEALQSP